MSQPVKKVLRVLLCLMIVSPFLPLGQAAGVPTAESSPYILRIVSSDCTFSPPSRQQTGFRVEGSKGIITALHGVIDCANITAYEDDTQFPLTSLEVSQVDIMRDAALLWSDALSKGSADGLEAGAEPSKETSGMHIIGYPGGVSYQGKKIGTFIHRNTLKRIIPDKFLPALGKRSSPDPDINILEIDASTTHGNSGSPLLNPKGQVIGMLDGGLNTAIVGESHDTGWAIPLKDIQWRKVSAVKSTFDQLAKNNPEFALAFTSTYPEYESGDIDFDPIYRESTPFRTSTTMRFYGAGSQNSAGQVQLESAFDVQSKRKFMNLSTNLPLNDMGALMGGDGISLDIYTVGGKDYVTLSALASQCMPLGPEVGFSGLQDSISDLFTKRMNADAPFEGVLLGEEEINGVRAKHYLINSPSTAENKNQTGLRMEQVLGGEMWITVKGNHMVRGTLEARYSADPGYFATLPRTGTMIGTVDFFDIGKRITIELPEACKKIATGTSGNPPKGTAVQATLKDVAIKYDVQQNGRKGMMLYVDFSLQNALNQPGAVAASVYFADGTPLKGFTPQFTNKDGTFGAYSEYTPKWAATDFTDWEVFVPYDELRLNEGTHNLQVIPYLYDYTSGSMLAVSSPIRFVFTQPGATRNQTIPKTGSETDLLLSQVTTFLNGAVQAEITAYYYGDASYAATHYSGAPLKNIQNTVAELNNKGLMNAAQLDSTRSKVAAVRSISAQKVEADTCEYWSSTIYERVTGNLVDTYPAALTPQTITIEQVGTNWLITEIEFFEAPAFCK